jgi:hypothetical protein
MGMDEDALAQEQLRVSLAVWVRATWAPLLARLGGAGRPLDLDAQQRMEALLGRDLGEVRIHDTQQAGEIAHRLGAEAFTIGPRIFAAPEGLAPWTPKGEALLAHELMHFVQQTQPSNKALIQPWGPSEPTLPLTANSSPQDEGKGLPNQGIPGPLPLQLAAEVPPAEPDAMEAQALAVEGAARERTAERARPANIDPHEIADRIYRLMQDDLRLERERRAFPH